MTPIATIGAFIAAATSLFFFTLLWLLASDEGFESLRDQAGNDLSDSNHNGGNAA